MGYNGGIDFVDRLTNTILDFYYDEAGYEITEEESEVVEEFAKEEI